MEDILIGISAIVTIAQVLRCTTPSNAGIDCHMPGCVDTSICPKKSLKPAQLDNSAILPSSAFQNNFIYWGVTVKGGARSPDAIHRSTVRAFLKTYKKEGVVYQI